LSGGMTGHLAKVKCLERCDTGDWRPCKRTTPISFQVVSWVVSVASAIHHRLWHKITSIC